MRQPASIYARALYLSGLKFQFRLARKARKILGVEEKTRVEPTPRPLIDLKQFARIFDELGIQKGDRVIAHSGISHIGKIKGGPAGLFDLLRERIGPEGVLLFPVFPFGTLMHSYLETAPSFDARTAPSKMGALTEIALKDPERIRSVHPTHSVAGFGDTAKDYLNEHDLDDTPFGPHSPFWRLADHGGKILVIGVGLSSVTGFHLPEDRLAERFPVRIYTDKIYEIHCLDDDGRERMIRTRCHDPFISYVRDCYLMEDIFQREGIYKKIALGNHYLGVIDFQKMDILLQKLAVEDRLTIYGKVWR